MTTFQPGIHRNIPAEEYHSANGVSNSQLKHLDPPARFPVALSTPVEVTPYMRMGTLVHHAILEPDRPLPGIVKRPETYTDEKGAVKPWHGSSNTCKAWLADHKRLGFEILTSEEFDTLRNCVRALEEDPQASALLSGCDTEVSVWAPLVLPSGREVTRRCRLDAVRSPVACDIKVVQAGMGAKRDFEKLAWDRRYVVQAAYYLDAWNSVCAEGEQLEAFVFVVVERAAPWLVSRYEIAVGSDVYLAGREQYLRDLEVYSLCVETKHWPGYQDGFQKLELPAWVRRNQND